MYLKRFTIAYRTIRPILTRLYRFFRDTQNLNLSKQQFSIRPHYD
jgi:hypothetical protein